MASVLIFYKTDWSPAVLHYAVQDHWKDAVGQDCDHLDQPGWQRIEVSGLPVKATIQFVLCNYTKTLWDNAAYGSYAPDSRNYVLQLSGEQTVSYTLMDGVLTQLTGPPVCVITDLDGTLLGQDDGLAQFNRYWQMSQMFKGSLLIYNTGRNLKDTLKAAAQFNLLKPSLAICGVGTEIYAFKEIHPHIVKENSHLAKLNIDAYLEAGVDPDLFDETIQDHDLTTPSWCPSRLHAVAEPGWVDIMTKSFDRLATERELRALLPGCRVNGGPYHDPYRLSLTVSLDLLLMGGATPASLIQTFEKLALKYNLLLSGEGEFRYLDVLPLNGGKRAPVEYICRKFNIPYQQVLVCGDSGNDIDMFTIEGINGCCVGNAQCAFRDALMGYSSSAGQERTLWDDLNAVVNRKKSVPTINRIHFSQKPCALGVLESLNVLNLDPSGGVAHNY
eukprot:Blabericola_migrator_1__1289@NODE_1334_length_4775_cov_276_346432_g896_i0_p2_GENE_NODE_1334_length_4775_cov_276_346432_g896_i0NODE_1334_length_4775_cov_276_346432_g896_i0_p2_ORF_typecomplete_len445_score46_31S6PP/PF05116_13/5_7e31Hydrolase_3/PF08282_12/0_00025Hydrolase_3/PF08282_12/9_2e10CBM_25/PF03423_13/4_4e06HAD/PF12710_7/86HAD/PF12710_7/5_4e03HAD/PF12710_7/0_13HAD_2/PF13419_6/2_9e02HAD_2/PF13419_6/0_96_NODE_1334_length_4775_cov_276_346432_g896_i016552989